MIPFLDHLQRAGRVLIAGCGGGFDVYSGVPLALRLYEAGKGVVLANLAFTNLMESGSARLAPTARRVDGTSGLPYLRERWLSEWLQRRGVGLPVYALGRTGVAPLAAAYREIMAEHGIDLVVLVDGGTDSLIFGDEPGLGTVEEDAVSVVAAHEAAGDRALLAILGFGVDHFHGVSHHSFLENAAQLTRDGGFLGAFSLTPGTPEADAFLELVDYVNQREPKQRGIVSNSIASAVRGEFGDYHATGRTAGSALFINPLMAQYWTFRADAVVARMAFASELKATTTPDEAKLVIERVRETLTLRPRRSIPL
jgi:hypothetical protein